jgi:uncharacterized protein YjiS (DUF1127 family)
MTIFEARSTAIQASSPGAVQHRDFDRSAILLTGHGARTPKKTHKSFSVLTRLQATFVARMTDWKNRRRSRSELLMLSDHDLLDIGIDQASAKLEARKPFWRS